MYGYKHNMYLCMCIYSVHICFHMHSYYVCIVHKQLTEEKTVKSIDLIKPTNFLNLKFLQGHKRNTCQNVNSEPECFSVSIWTHYFAAFSSSVKTFIHPMHSSNKCQLSGVQKQIRHNCYFPVPKNGMSHKNNNFNARCCAQKG